MCIEIVSAFSVDRDWCNKRICEGFCFQTQLTWLQRQQCSVTDINALLKMTRKITMKRKIWPCIIDQKESPAISD